MSARDVFLARLGALLVRSGVSRPALATFLAIVALCVVDYSDRVHVPALSSEPLRLREVSSMGEIGMLPANMGESVQAWLPQGNEHNSETKKLKLVGVSRAHADWSAIMVLIGSSGPATTKVVRVGDTIEGWTVESIESGAINLRRGDESSRQQLFRRN